MKLKIKKREDKKQVECFRVFRPRVILKAKYQNENYVVAEIDFRAGKIRLHDVLYYPNKVHFCDLGNVELNPYLERVDHETDLRWSNMENEKKYQIKKALSETI